MDKKRRLYHETKMAYLSASDFLYLIAFGRSMFGSCLDSGYDSYTNIGCFLLHSNWQTSDTGIFL